MSPARHTWQTMYHQAGGRMIIRAMKVWLLIFATVATVGVTVIAIPPALDMAHETLERWDRYNACMERTREIIKSEQENVANGFPTDAEWCRRHHMEYSGAAWRGMAAMRRCAKANGGNLKIC
jgi:hypothetical protein